MGVSDKEYKGNQQKKSFNILEVGPQNSISIVFVENWTNCASSQNMMLSMKIQVLAIMLAISKIEHV